MIKSNSLTTSNTRFFVFLIIVLLLTYRRRNYTRGYKRDPAVHPSPPPFSKSATKIAVMDHLHSARASLCLYSFRCRKIRAAFIKDSEAECLYLSDTRDMNSIRRNTDTEVSFLKVWTAHGYLLYLKI